jgi:excinuclease ABC subunit A
MTKGLKKSSVPDQSPAKRSRALTIHQAAEHNLKDISLSIPHDSFTVITGLSGSGKSSLAFDTIYAEGQRRYLETFSPYVRQFFDKVKKPQVGFVEQVRPTIAIQQRTRINNSRSTVGSMTGLLDYLKGIWNALSQPVCGTCGINLEQWTPTQLAERFGRIIALFPNHPFLIAAPLPLPQKRGGLKAELARLGLLGFSRILAPRTGVIISTDGELSREIRKTDEEILVVLDRVITSSTNPCDLELSRLREAIEQSFALSGGRCALIRFGPQKGNCPSVARRPFAQIEQVGRNRSLLGQPYLRSDFWERAQCPSSQQALLRPRPGLFSFNHPLGACPTCKGFGSVLVTDIERCIPDPRLSIDDGCIACWNGDAADWERKALKKFCAEQKIPTNQPWQSLTEEQKTTIITTDTKSYCGIRPWFEWLEKKIYKMHVRVFLNRYRKQEICSSCKGTRLKEDALSYRIGELSIAQVWSKSVGELLVWTDHLCAKIPSFESLPREVRELFAAFRSRLSFLDNLGLSYLTLDRPARTLSGGETQRVNLAGALGSGLTSTHFVLDEPSVGLHPRDSDRLLASLHTLHQRGNTLTVVEHDPQIIAAAEEIIELGPGSGSTGGDIVYHGPASGWTGIDFTPPPRNNREEGGQTGTLSIMGASARNIRDIHLSIPLGSLVCITGVSGCGKSTLVQEIIAREYERRALGLSPVHRIEGFDQVEELLIVDQTPLAKSPRANIATYTKIWDPIRTLLADTEDARSRALTKSSFSFNVEAGRCLTCEGGGAIKEDMQFLSDVYLICETCLGKRFQPSVLEVRWNEKTVDDLLNLSIDDARILFEEYRKICGPLDVLHSLGLGHLTLGHSLSELSGGEAQRLKLVPLISGTEKRSRTSSSAGSLVVFDEPTTGLHVRDVMRLVTVCRALRDRGHTVVCIEHNLSFINEADWVVDMGPEGGAGGGNILFTGPPEALASFEGTSFTARYLREYRAERERNERNAGLISSYAPQTSRTSRQSEVQGSENLDKVLQNSITIRGAREHNLRGVDLNIPLEKTIAITGVSGSGKSTIAKDILFAEGQRRYLDCLSPYAQQFIKDVRRPDLDKVENIPPSIYVNQHASSPGTLSTVGTITEVYQFLRLLFVKLGTQYCIEHPDAVISGGTISDMVGQVRQVTGRAIRLLAPIVVKKKGNHKAIFQRALNSEIHEVRVDGIFCKATSCVEGLEKSKAHSIDFVVGKIDPTRTDDDLITSAVSLALSLGGGQAIAVSDAGETVLSATRMCPVCKRGYLSLDPEDLSFHSKRGRCRTCDGLGINARGEPCHECAGTRINQIGQSLRLAGRSIGEASRLPAHELIPFLESIPLKAHHRPVAEPIFSEITSRINHLIALGIGALPLDRASHTLSGGELQRLRLAAAMGSPLTGVLYLFDEPSAGLHPSDNRLVLKQIAKLKDAGNTVVVIEHDPATIASCDQIIEIGPGGGAEGGLVMFQGSTSSFSESEGGERLFELHEPMPRYHEGDRTTNPSKSHEPAPTLPSPVLHIEGSSRTVKDLALAIPLQRFVAIAGVSGAGKSTLLHDMLAKTITEGQSSQGQGVETIFKKDGCLVRSSFDLGTVVSIDQTPLGSHSRSVPASYLGFWDDIRKLFASTVEAKTLGWSPSDFSFNAGRGRCATCGGLGTISLQMSFLSEASMTCESCDGARFIDDITHIRYRGCSVSEVLSLSFNEARNLFSAHKKIHRITALACDLGLGYLTIGQRSSTLSGGEAQRIKLVQELAQNRTRHTIYLLDEPTIGLHRADVRKLVSVLHTLVERGHSVMCIEHDPDLLLAADHVIEMGPGAAEAGGRVIFEGAPARLRGRDTPWGRELCT